MSRKQRIRQRKYKELRHDVDDSLVIEVSRTRSLNRSVVGEVTAPRKTPFKPGELACILDEIARTLRDIDESF